jgi:hypothetical protein
MHIYDLEFTDGKSCRYLSPEPEPTEEAERKSLESMFCGRLKSMVRIITPPPERLPWKPERRGLWTLGLFILERLDAETFKCRWPGSEVIGGKEEISAVVRLHWAEGC